MHSRHDLAGCWELLDQESSEALPQCRHVRVPVNRLILGERVEKALPQYQRAIRVVPGLRAAYLHLFHFAFLRSNDFTDRAAGSCLWIQPDRENDIRDQYKRLQVEIGPLTLGDADRRNLQVDI